MTTEQLLARFVNSGLEFSIKFDPREKAQKISLTKGKQIYTVKVNAKTLITDGNIFTAIQTLNKAAFG